MTPPAPPYPRRGGASRHCLHPKDRGARQAARRILLINVNTAASITDRLVAIGNAIAPPGATSTSWQTPAGTTSAWLLVDAGAALSWRALGVFNTNLTTAATLRWRLGNDPGFATALQDSGTLSGTIAAGFRQGLRILPSAVTARYLRIDIADPANPEGALRIAQLYAGTAVAALRSISRQSAFLRIADAPSLTTRGGQEFPLLRHARRAWQVSLPALAQSEVWPLVHALQQAAEDGRNILFVPFPAGPDSAREAVFGRLLAPSAITWPGPGLRSWSATITERL